MTEEILVPTDGSEGATAALEHALEVAEAAGATVHALFVVDTTRDGLRPDDDDVIDVFDERGGEIVAEAAERAAEHGVAVVEAVEHGDPHETILAYAEEASVDLIVMGTHGRRGLRRLFLGSVTERVVRTATVPVLTVRETTVDARTFPYEDVLVAIDGSECATAALERASELAAEHGATLHVLSVVDVTAAGTEVASGQLLEALESDARGVVEDAAANARERGVESVVTAVEVGSVSRAITGYADEEGIDLAVVGTHGRRGVNRYVMGSVAELVVRTASCPVLTVRRADENGAHDEAQ